MQYDLRPGVDHSKPSECPSKPGMLWKLRRSKSCAIGVVFETLNGLVKKKKNTRLLHPHIANFVSLN